ncbi:MAG: hemolysin III family protein [Candidatus Marinimicrobia bacterium]|nr:hemolysin III family protein [Candidatus Neomarinimicrobiota bacterium]
MIQAKYPNESRPRRLYTVGEELANILSHGLGAALSVAGLVVLVVLAFRLGDPWRVTSFAIYGSTLIILYLASTLYHSVQDHRVKGVLRTIDHAGIYLLIAGTYTPILLVSMRGAWGWTLLGVIWGLALMGVVLQSLSFQRLRRVELFVYLMMGWLFVIAWREMIVSISSGGLIWIAVGGLLYTIGVIFYAWHKLPYHHAVWHLFVLAGSVSHFFAMLLHVLPEA